MRGEVSGEIEEAETEGVGEVLEVEGVGGEDPSSMYVEGINPSKK